MPRNNDNNTSSGKKIKKNTICTISNNTIVENIYIGTNDKFNLKKLRFI